MKTAASGGSARREVFRVEIIRQDNHSWKGQIFWVNEDKRQNFRSELELMQLIASTVAKEDEFHSFGGRNPSEDVDEICAPPAADAIGAAGHVALYSLRKAFGYFAWQAGAAPALLMDIFNHSSFEVTRRYLGISQQDRDKVYLGMALF